MAQSWSNDQGLHSDETSDILLTLGACNSRDGSTERVYAPRYLGRRQPDVKMFRWMQECLRGRWSVEHLRYLWLQVAHGLHGHQPVKIPDLHSIILVLSSCASAAAFRPVSSGTLSWGPCTYTARQANCSTIRTYQFSGKIFYRTFLKMWLSVWPNLWFQCDGSPIHNGEVFRQWLNAT